MTARLRVVAWSLLISVAWATILWFSREWLHEVRLRLFEYLYFPAVMLAIVMSPNVHAPSDFLVWLAIVLQTFAMALLVAKVIGIVRRKVRSLER